MQELKEKEKLIYNYIIDVIRREGYSPSVRDIQNAMDIKSTSTVHSYLAKLEKKGYIQKESGKSRTLRAESFATEPQRTVRVPILGRVAAGMPILAIENHEGYIDFPVMNRYYQANQLYSLRVKGESMIDHLDTSSIYFVCITPIHNGAYSRSPASSRFTSLERSASFSAPGMPSSAYILFLYASTPGWSKGLTPSV